MIALEWDFSYSSILVDRSPDAGMVFLDAEQLGLSAQLCERLADWLQRQEVLSGHWMRQWFHDEPVTEESRRLQEDLGRDGRTLAWEVQHEMGPDVQVLLNGRALDEPHAR